jgi:3D (Asp-Asp-Asp) domain-containing protein
VFFIPCLTLDRKVKIEYNRTTSKNYMSSSKKYLTGIFAFLIVVFPLVSNVKADQTISDLEAQNIDLLHEPVLTIQDNSFIPNASHFHSSSKAVKTIYVIVTAYSSTPLETDDTPFITALGTTVRDGIVAANFLPFGTKIKIPELFGSKIFVVEDRMSPTKGYHIDVWFPSREQALNFGAHLTYIEIIE